MVCVMAISAVNFYSPPCEGKKGGCWRCVCRSYRAGVKLNFDLDVIFPLLPFTTIMIPPPPPPPGAQCSRMFQHRTPGEAGEETTGSSESIGGGHCQ